MQSVVRGALAVLLVGAVLAGAPPAMAQEPAYGGAAAELAEQIAAAFPKVSGRIIGLERERILLDLSAKDKVIPGLELQVYRPGQEFKHPYTGQSLGKLDRDVGRVRIIEVQDGFSVAEVIQQTEGTMVQQGDLARMTSARVILALPNVDVADVAGANTRSVTRDLVNALVKTNRFEVMTDQRLRAAVAEEKIQFAEQFGDPAVLQALWKRLRVSAVLLAKLTLLEKAVQWDVQLVSTVRGDSIMLASAEVKGMAARATASRGDTTSFLGREAPRIDQIAMRSQEVPYKATAMAVGDLTGDGTSKLAITDGQGVYIYDVDKNGIKLLWSTKGNTTDNILSVDAADINGNGVAEIFVTNYTRGQARAYVLEYQKGKFTRVSEDIPLHFRVLEGPAGTPQLYGQAAGQDRPFDGPVRRYHWQGNRYVPAETVVLPKPFNLLYGFGFADLDGDNAPEILIVDQNDYLRVFDRGGSELYRSGEHYGGSDRMVEFDPTRSGSNPISGIQPERLMLQGRMFFQDITGNGKKQLILPRNTPSTGYVFQTRLYDRGKVFGLSWDGVGMQATWETRDLPGYIADFALTGEAGGDRKLVLLVVQTNLIGVGKTRSTVLLLDLRPPA